MLPVPAPIPAPASLAPFRVGSVGYLNAAPLTFGLEREILFTVPSRLAALLRRGELDAGLVSIAEVLLHDRYEVLDGIAIAAQGAVASVLLAHRGPLTDVREVCCDPASLTGVNLAKVLLAERGLRPVFTPLSSYAAAPQCAAVVLIGDPAIEFVRARTGHQIWDLGSAWRELTGLPFVYAAWALQRGLAHAPLGRVLRAARDRGVANLETIIRDRPEHDEAFRRHYFTHHIQFGLGPDERRAMAAFAGLLRRHGLGPAYNVRLVD